MKNEEGKKENVTPDDITKQETDIDPDLTPEDWTTGNEEDIEIGTKEDFITPGGQANDWQQGEDLFPLSHRHTPRIISPTPTFALHYTG